MENLLAGASIISAERDVTQAASRWHRYRWC